MAPQALLSGQVKFVLAFFSFLFSLLTDDRFLSHDAVYFIQGHLSFNYGWLWHVYAWCMHTSV